MSNANSNHIHKASSVSRLTIGKKERKQLWESLAKFCNELIEETNKNGYKPNHQFFHPQSMIDIFIKLGLRPPKTPRTLEKFHDNFIKKCKYLSDNAHNSKINKTIKNTKNNPSNKGTPKGRNNRTKYNQNRGQYYSNNNINPNMRSHNKTGSFPISSQKVQHHYHQYATQYNMNKQQLITQLPAPRNPTFGRHIVNYNNNNNTVNLQNIQIPLHLQNKQFTSADNIYAQPQQQQQIIYHVQNNNYYQINVGQSNQNRVNMQQANNNLRIAVDNIPKGLPRNISIAYTPIPQMSQFNNNQQMNTHQQNRTFHRQNKPLQNNNQNNNTIINMNTNIIGPHSFGLQTVPELKENYTPKKQTIQSPNAVETMGTFQQIDTLKQINVSQFPPNDVSQDIYHSKKNSINIAQNNLIRSHLLDAQAFMIDSNYSNMSGRSYMSDNDVFTLGFINTDGGKQVSALFEYLQNNIKTPIICLDLNAMRSRSVSISMHKHARKPTDDMEGMVFNQQNVYNTNDIETIDEKNYFAQVTTLNENTVNNYENYQNNKLDTLWNKLSNKSSNSNYQNNKLDHLFKSMSNKSNISAFSAGSIRRGSFAAPHNDLDGLVIFEPVKPFEILDLYRSRTKDDAFESVRGQFEKILQKAFLGCVKYLKHRIKHTVSQIKYVFFVTFAMPNAVDNVSSIWYDLCQLRMEHITNTARKCNLLCESSKMKFVGCITPVDPNSFNNKTDKITEEDICSNDVDFLANYHLPDYAKYQSYLTFKNTVELSDCIKKTLQPQIK